MVLTTLELLYLRRLVLDDIFTQEARLARYDRIRSRYDEGVFLHKTALADTELDVLQKLRRKINQQLAVRDLTDFSR